jgi:hypothetical protein
MTTSTIVTYPLVWDENRRCIISTREGILLDVEVSDAGSEKKESMTLSFLEPDNPNAIVSRRQFGLVLPGEKIDTTITPQGRSMLRSGYWRTIPKTKYGKAYLFEFPV